MSFENWRTEFYPIDADQVESDAISLVEHSLQKWKGLQLENLDKHYVQLSYECLMDGSSEVLEINDSSCALCHHFREPDKSIQDQHLDIFTKSVDEIEAEIDEMNLCKTCPISQMTGRDCEGAYTDFVTESNPESMIIILNKTLFNLKVRRFFKNVLDTLWR